MNTITAPMMSSYRVTKKLATIITDTITASGQDTSNGATINFANSDYQPGNGYHPVEIRVHASGELDYITDFSYVGLGQDVELIKELDFDFTNCAFGQSFMGQLRYTIAHQARGIYRTWQANFCDYHRHGAYDQITVTPN